MLIIRLQRVGKKNQPSYRVVLAEKSYPVKGKFIEILGNYNPRSKVKTINKERILYWLSKGAKASPTMHNLLVSGKIIEAAKVKAWAPKKKEKKESEGATTGETEEKKEELTATAGQEQEEETKSDLIEAAVGEGKSEEEPVDESKANSEEL